MNAKKIARRLKHAGLGFVLAGAIITAAGGCSALSYFGELNYLRQWVTSYFGSNTGMTSGTLTGTSS
ncbi:MAG TPA: hypothetical protein VMV94_17480 [Phycisphaerae bacterium]|nr:hypothetical protein [Phycisphaerae bacterium]